MNQVKISGVVAGAPVLHGKNGIAAVSIELRFTARPDIIKVVTLKHDATEKLRGVSAGDSLKITGMLIYFEGTGIAIMAEKIEPWRRARGTVGGS